MDNTAELLNYKNKFLVKNNTHYANLLLSSVILIIGVGTNLSKEGSDDYWTTLSLYTSLYFVLGFKRALSKSLLLERLTPPTA